MKERANNKECLLDLHKRLREIEKKFNTKLDEEQRGLWSDLTRDVIVPLDSESTVSTGGRK